MPDLPTAAPSAPSATEPSAVVLPPLTVPDKAHSAVGESQMTLMSPTALSEQNETDWAIVIGIALVAEIGLLWGAACVGLWRRRIALYRAASKAAEAGPAMG